MSDLKTRWVTIGLKLAAALALVFAGCEDTARTPGEAPGAVPPGADDGTPGGGDSGDSGDPGVPADASDGDAGPSTQDVAPAPDAPDAQDADPDPTCTDACPDAGLTTCVDGGVTTCGDFDMDACLEWSAPEPCGDGQACVAGVCACQDACDNDGATFCDGDAVVTCVDANGDGCLELGAPVPCDGRETCSAGACSSTCTDECDAAGTSVCDGNTVRFCGQLDTDACLDLSTPTPCGPTETCEGGVCVTACTDECVAAGATTCDPASSGFKTCGQFDADPCLELSSTTPCASFQTCEDGTCVTGCTDECTLEGATVCDGDAVKTCGNWDADDCLEYTSPAACPTGQSCEAGECVAGCTDTCDFTGQVVCQSDGVATCGQFDGDPCLELSGVTPCPAGQSCADGVCLGASCPDQDCDTPWALSCKGSTGFQVCVPDAETGCLDKGLFVSCQAGNSCSAGVCSGACVAPEVLVLVDRSSSMVGPVWDFTKATLIDWAVDFEPVLKLGVRPFPSDGCAPGVISPMTVDNAGAFVGALVEPSVAAATPLAGALDGLDSAFGDPNQGEVVVLISDGSETCADEDTLITEAQALQARGTTIHAIGVGFGYDEILLTQVAEITGGTFTAAANGEALRTALDGLVDEVMGCEQSPIGLTECQFGVCSDVACDAGYHLCEGQCVSNADVATCGTSCEPCAVDLNGVGTPACVDEQCTLVCPGGQHACDGACVDSSSVAHCGGSCSPCPDSDYGTATCDGTSCGFDCGDGSLLCDGECSPCPQFTANGTPACSGTQCVLDCGAGFEPCFGGQACCYVVREELGPDMTTPDVEIEVDGRPLILSSADDGDAGAGEEDARIWNRYADGWTVYGGASTLSTTWGISPDYDLEISPLGVPTTAIRTPSFSELWVSARGPEYTSTAWAKSELPEGPYPSNPELAFSPSGHTVVTVSGDTLWCRPPGGSWASETLTSESLDSVVATSVDPLTGALWVGYEEEKTFGGSQYVLRTRANPCSGPWTDEIFDGLSVDSSQLVAQAGDLYLLTVSGSTATLRMKLDGATSWTVETADSSEQCVSEMHVEASGRVHLADRASASSVKWRVRLTDGIWLQHTFDAFPDGAPTSGGTGCPGLAVRKDGAAYLAWTHGSAENLAFVHVGQRALTVASTTACGACPTCATCSAGGVCDGIACAGSTVVDTCDLCDPGQICVDGFCLTDDGCGLACSDTQECIDGECVNTGPCAGGCPTGQGCAADGTCQPGTASPTSCFAACGANAGACYCDSACFGYGDCCDDVCTWCDDAACP